MKKKLDTARSNQFFQELIKEFERKKVADLLEITTVHLWRLCFRNHAPSKKIIRKLSQWRGTSYQEMEQIILGEKLTIPECSYPNIRKAITHNALFDQQRENILFANRMTQDEKLVITYYYLVSKGIRYLDTQQFCEVISPEQQTSAIQSCEEVSNLPWSFKATLGAWWKWDNVYYFKNSSLNGNGITFVESMEELILKRKIKNYCMKAMENFQPNL